MCNLMNITGVGRGAVVPAWRFLVLFLLSGVLAGGVYAQGNIVLAIKAVNPTQTDSTVRVSALLPKGVKPADVVDAAGMEVKYDPNVALYCVRAEERLPAGGNREYRVVLRDIWVVPAELIAELRTHAVGLAGQLAGTKRKDSAASIRMRIEGGLDQLEKWQERYRAGPSATPVAHIQAYGRSMDLLKRVIDDTGILETQAKDEGIYVPKPLGPPPPRAEAGEAAVGETPRKIRLDIRNAGRTEQKIPVRSYLPREVRPEDVSGDDRVEVRYDAERSACYLFSEGIAVGPNETVNIEVLVADRWIVAPGRYALLETKATNVQAKAVLAGRDDVKNQAQALLNQLVTVRAAERPPFGDEYIADYHRKVEDVDRIEEELLKLEARMAPSQERPIFDASVLNQVEAPSRSTTWIIVFTVIGFLFFFSVLLFLRWYGKAKDETMSG